MDHVEAVIISGPRKGEIIQLSEDELDKWSEADIEQLNFALDSAIHAVDRLSREMDLTLEALRQH